MVDAVYNWFQDNGKADIGFIIRFLDNKGCTCLLFGMLVALKFLNQYLTSVQTDSFFLCHGSCCAIFIVLFSMLFPISH